MIAKASCLHPSKDKGFVVRTLIFWRAKQTKFSFKQLTASTEISKQTLQELHAVDDSAVIQRANLQGALRQSDDKPYGDQLTCRNLSSTFYATDVELWFNQIETQFALHHITDDDERYSLTCAALSGEVASTSEMCFCNLSAQISTRVLKAS